LQPIFNGRLVGVPELRQNEIVKLQFVARPDDYTAQKLALTDSMMVLPFYDPAFLTSQSPDTVLEAYSALFHIDRTTLELTASDILQGEDGIIPSVRTRHFTTASACRSDRAARRFARSRFPPPYHGRRKARAWWTSPAC
jgi:hypothetical protein